MGEEYQDTASALSIPKDDAFDALRVERRRAALQYLMENEDNAAPLGEIAEAIAASEYDTTPANLGSQDRKRIYVGLYQTHVPRLEEYGLVSVDRDMVSLEDEAQLLEPLLGNGDGDCLTPGWNTRLSDDSWNGYQDTAVYNKAVRNADVLSSRLNDALSPDEDYLDEKVSELLPELNTEQDLEIAHTLVTTLADGGTKADAIDELDYSANTVQSRYDVLADAGLVSRNDGSWSYTVKHGTGDVLRKLADRAPLTDVKLDERDLDILETALPHLATGASVKDIAEDIDEIGYQSVLWRFREKYEEAGLIEADGLTRSATDDLYTLVGTSVVKTAEPAGGPAEAEHDWFDSERQKHYFLALAGVFQDGGTQADVAELLDVTSQTVGNHYRELEERGAFVRDGHDYTVSTDWLDEFADEIEDVHLDRRIDIASDTGELLKQFLNSADVTIDVDIDEVDWSDIDVDELYEALQNEYTQKVFENGVEILSQDGATRQQIIDASDVSRDAVDRHYKRLEELGVFDSTDAGPSLEYEVSPAAEKLYTVLQEGGWEGVRDELDELISYPVCFDSGEQWDVFTEIASSLRQHELMKDVEERRDDLDYHDVKQVFDSAVREGFLSRDGPNYRPEYTIHFDRMAEEGILEDVERGTLQAVAATGTENAEHLQRFVDGYEQTNIDFRDRWEADELPENLILPQWQELLAVARSTALWDGTIDDSTTWLDCGWMSLEKRLERLPDNAVSIGPENEEISLKDREVAVHPRFQSVLESFSDRLLFDPEDVTYAEELSEDSQYHVQPSEELESDQPTGEEDTPDRPVMFRDYQGDPEKR